MFAALGSFKERRFATAGFRAGEAPQYLRLAPLGFAFSWAVGNRPSLAFSPSAHGKRLQAGGWRAVAGSVQRSETTGKRPVTKFALWRSAEEAKPNVFLNLTAATFRSRRTCDSGSFDCAPVPQPRDGRFAQDDSCLRARDMRPYLASPLSLLVPKLRLGTHSSAKLRFAMIEAHLLAGPRMPC